MSAWLNNVVSEGGEWCRNCSGIASAARCWRVLHGRELEECSNCGDEAFDVYDFDEDDPY